MATIDADNRREIARLPSRPVMMNNKKEKDKIDLLSIST
jgi:hypothetical protein